MIQFGARPLRRDGRAVLLRGGWRRPGSARRASTTGVWSGPQGPRPGRPCTSFMPQRRLHAPRSRWAGHEPVKLDGRLAPWTSCWSGAGWTR
ncbi:hypothetical protein QJS66_06510 [Kocuria rhizophila]|nr:hypothetical protein QJS66_06510 [Kocuria rhizophila]